MNETTTVRISKDVYNEVKSLAKSENQNMQRILEQAVKEYKKKKFFEDLNTSFAKLKANSNNWNDEIEERELWEPTLADGLEIK
jgi:predicted transcriptional regulator